MGDYAVVPDGHRTSSRCLSEGHVHHGGSPADLNARVVRAYYGPGPYTSPVSELHLTNHHCRFIDEHVISEGRLLVSVIPDGHSYRMYAQANNAFTSPAYEQLIYRRSGIEAIIVRMLGSTLDPRRSPLER